MIKAKQEGWAPIFDINEAVQVPDTKIRLFGKPMSKVGRRMGVVIAAAKDTDTARANAAKAADSVKISY